jgi:hypothetical protein
MADEQYYALCGEDGQGEPEIAFFELSKEALPGCWGSPCTPPPMANFSAVPINSHERPEDGF